MELSCCKYPVASTLDQEWQLNKEPMLRYMEAVHMGFRGVVVDADDDSLPVFQAIIEMKSKLLDTRKWTLAIFISLLLPDIAYNVTTTERGEFWRLLLPGNYWYR